MITKRNFLATGASMVAAPCAAQTEQQPWTPPGPDIIHIHEDAWGMRNLYPLTVRDEVDKDMAEAVAAAERNRDPSGLGYNGMYAIKPPSLDYAVHGLTLAAVASALTPILPRVRQFNATIYSAMDSAQLDPLGIYEENAWCFGTGPRCFVKIDPKGELAANIWFDVDPDDLEARSLIRKAVLAIDALAPSVIADYYVDFSGPVSDADQLNRYFALLAA